MKRLVVMMMLMTCAWLAALPGRAQEATMRRELTGLWHVTPDVGAGWADRYRFFADGTFRFQASQYNGEQRLLEQSGRYRVEARKLHLSVTRRLVLEGGRKVPAGPSTTSPYEIVGARRVVKIVSPPLEKTLTLGELEQGIHEPDRTSLLIGGVRYFKMSGEPGQ